MVRQIADLIRHKATLSKSPDAVDSLKFVVVAPGNNCLHGESWRSLCDGKIRPGRSDLARNFDDGISDQVFCAGTTALVSENHLTHHGTNLGTTARSCRREEIVTVSEQLANTVEIAVIDPLGVRIQQIQNCLFVSHS